MGIIKRLLILILIISFGWFLFYELEVLQPAGILVPDAPEQTENLSNINPWQFKEYTITPLAKYSAKARVLSKNYYFVGREAELGNYDLALGWQEMSDNNVLEPFEISQSNRWYRIDLKPKKIPQIDRNLIQYKSGNMHIIAGNEGVIKTLKQIKKGNIISLDGYLIEAKAQDGWSWRSSLVSSSFGSTGCKVIWVDNLKVEK
jgi:hypothetical protein